LDALFSTACTLVLGRPARCAGAPAVGQQGQDCLVPPRQVGGEVGQVAVARVHACKVHQALHVRWAPDAALAPERPAWGPRDTFLADECGSDRGTSSACVLHSKQSAPQLHFALRLESDAKALVLCCRVQGGQFGPGGRKKPSCMGPHVGIPAPGTACLYCFSTSWCHTTLGVSALQSARSCKHTRCLCKAQHASSKLVGPRAAAPLELQNCA